MASIGTEVLDAPSFAFGMFWEILWALILGWQFTLNIVFLILAAALVWRYFRRGGGIAMLRMMNAPSGAAHHRH